LEEELTLIDFLSVKTVTKNSRCLLQNATVIIYCLNRQLLNIGMDGGGLDVFSEGGERERERK
jgi:hypothetical protein